MFLRFWLVAALSICPPVLSPVLADSLPMLTLAEREAWTAVGRVNSAGYRKLKACTGTLIAPDLVLTAAHCAGLTADGKTSLHFVAGYDRGRYIAHRTISSGNEHPLYSRTEGNEKLRFDVAVLRLDAPIPPEIISPAELIDDGDGGGAKAILLGYHNIRPDVLNGREDCALLNKTQRFRLYDCEVISGNSGGPVLEETPDGLRLSGVIVASSGHRGDALVVPVGAWLRDTWRRALAQSQRN